MFVFRIYLVDDKGRKSSFSYEFRSENTVKGFQDGYERAMDEARKLEGFTCRMRDMNAFWVAPVKAKVA